MDQSPPRTAPPAEAPPAEPFADTAARRRSGVRSAIEWVVIVAAALLAALLIKTFLLQAFYIPSDSMNPTLVRRDRVLVNKLSYQFHDVHRGDIVVFKRPKTETDPRVKDLIKRVVGLPGETIESHDGHVFVNGRQLKEGYIKPGAVTPTIVPLRIPSGQYYVMGDNRSNSRDSHIFGPIPRSLIVGRAFIRVWPLSAIGLL